MSPRDQVRICNVVVHAQVNFQESKQTAAPLPLSQERGSMHALVALSALTISADYMPVRYGYRVPTQRELR